MATTTTYTIEHTDTYGGEANYCWVRRSQVAARDMAQAVRAAKAFAGWTGRRTRKQDNGDMVRLDLCGVCQCIFICWKDPADPRHHQHIGLDGQPLE